MATYKEITLDEMKECLASLGYDKEVCLDGVGEFVFGKICKFSTDDTKIFTASIRVFTSISKAGFVRSKGTDAIRVSAVYRAKDGSIRAISHKAKRVHRVANWKKNLANRIKSVEDSLRTIQFCPKCQAPMAERTVKATGNKFLGCSDFPRCNGTRSI